MRLFVICTQCATEEPKSFQPFTTLEWQDGVRYEAECPKGHKTLTLLQQQNFELLYEIGAYAINDGYYREAVVSFTSSLERFYEFFIRAVLLERKFSKELIAEAWKPVAKLSERQLGAFIFLYTSEFQKPPRVLSPKYVEMRNDVIHRGKIPSRTQAIDYGQHILDIVGIQLRETKQKYPTGVQATIVDHLMSGKIGPEQRPTTMCIPTIISLSIGDEKHHERPLAQALEELKGWTKRANERSANT